MQQATEVLQVAPEDWTNPDGSTGFKPPSTIDMLRRDPEFVEESKDALVALIGFSPARAHAAE